MPAAIPSSGGGSAAAHPTRLPTASSSLRVQLPPDSFLSAFANPNPTPPSAAAAVASSSRPVGAPPPPKTSDATLLAQGILEQQRKAKEILACQEKLMEDREITREELKRGLTRLSIPYWLQILQERSIYNLCGYPTCRNKLPSSSSSSSTSTAPRYRISVSRGAIERDTSNDPGGRNNFCSQTCHARSEWVRRWVLNPSSGVDDSAAGGGGLGIDSRGVGRRDLTLLDPMARQMRKIGQEQALQGGKWEALMSRREDQWAEIELLEDLEENGELDAWDGFGSTHTKGGQSIAQEDTKGSTDHPNKSPTTSIIPTKPHVPTSQPDQKSNPSASNSRLGPLTISERTPTASSSSSSSSTTTKAKPLPRHFHPSNSKDLDSLFELGPSASLKKSLRDVSRRLNEVHLSSTDAGGGGSVPPPPVPIPPSDRSSDHYHGDGDLAHLSNQEGRDSISISLVGEEKEEEEEEEESLDTDEETRDSRRLEGRMLDEALRLRDGLRERGELD